MSTSLTTTGSAWPLLVYVGLVVALIAVLVGGGAVLGERHRQRLTGRPYESGMPSEGSPRGPLPVQFFRVAVFFVIFDVETVFIFAWAVALREAGWTGYFEMLVFIGVLVAVLAYLWRSGSLDWGDVGRRAAEARRRDRRA